MILELTRDEASLLSDSVEDAFDSLYKRTNKLKKSKGAPVEYLATLTQLRELGDRIKEAMKPVAVEQPAQPAPSANGSTAAA